MGRPTTKDLARAAGVSLATVDRVLNARAGVRPATIERVNRAIKEIAFVRDISAANLARRKEYRLVFLLPDHDDEFIDAIRASVDETNRAMAHDRINVSVVRGPMDNPHRIAAQLDDLARTEIDGIAIMTPETPQVRDAILRLSARGIAVVAFVSNQPNAESVSFVGINNEAAGRTVGQLMARFTGERKGSVLVLTETMLSRDSQERRHGFESIMARHAPRLRVCPSMETRGDAQRTARILRAALRSNAPVVGLYLLHHDIKDIMHTLETDGHAKNTVIIGHELTPHTRARLLDGTMDAVITQDVGHLVRSSIRILRARADGVDTVESQERIRIEITLRENMPE